MKSFLKQLRPAIMCLLMMTLICGLLYMGLLTGIAQLVYPRKANGSIITVSLKDGSKKDFGSRFIGQEFTKSKYLIGRPMKISNLSPVSAEQAALVRKRIAFWHRLERKNKTPIPLDLLTASGSGVDPYITPEAAEYQAARIAKARNMKIEAVRSLIKKYTSPRFIGFIGESGVNVLLVNLALDGLIEGNREAKKE